MLKQEQLQRDQELLKIANAPKWTSIDPLQRHWKKTLWPIMNQPIPGLVDSGQWIVDSGQRREMGNGGKQTWKKVSEREQEDLSPSLPNPAPSPFFLAHFSLRFPNYLKACYRLTMSFTMPFTNFYGIYRIYSINRPERLLNFCFLRVGAYSRWVLIRGWALIKCSPCIFSK